jgi:hypothetical protein
MSVSQEELSKKPLDERIREHIVDTTGYQKFSKPHFTQRTGSAVKTNEVPFLVILDFDINKQLDQDQRESISKDLISKLNVGTRIVKSGHGGLHIYCNQGDFELASNREIKCYKCALFDLDLFGCQDPS